MESFGDDQIVPESIEPPEKRAKIAERIQWCIKIMNPKKMRKTMTFTWTRYMRKKFTRAFCEAFVISCILAMVPVGIHNWAHGGVS